MSTNAIRSWTQDYLCFSLWSIPEKKLLKWLYQERWFVLNTHTTKRAASALWKCEQNTYVPFLCCCHFVAVAPARWRCCRDVLTHLPEPQWKTRTRFPAREVINPDVPLLLPCVLRSASLLGWCAIGSVTFAFMYKCECLWLTGCWFLYVQWP